MPSWWRERKRLFSSLHTVHRECTHTRPVSWGGGPGVRWGAEWGGVRGEVG